MEENNKMVSELRKARGLAVSLAREVDMKNQRLWEIERHNLEISSRLNSMISEKDRMNHAFSEGVLLTFS